jgi:hypothetical protein
MCCGDIPSGYCLAFRVLSGIFDSEKLLRHGLMSIPPRRV